MRSWVKLIVPALVILGGPFANAAGPGRDYAPFVTVQGYERIEFTEHRFDKAVFVSDDKGTKTTVAGHFFNIKYRLTDPTAGGDPYLLSSLQEQVKQIQGAQILNQTDRCGSDNPSNNPVLTVRFQKGNIPVWVAVNCDGWLGGAYYVTVVEEQAFHQ
jgi:hypothetical protein